MPADRLRRTRERALRREDRLQRREGRGERRRERIERRTDEPAGAPVPGGDEGDTRRRLIEAAAPLFAEHGLDAVTVRDICAAAGANVAAINYHFGDKAGLYAEVVKLAIEAIRANNADSMQPATDASPEERLAWYIRGQLERVTRTQRGSWVFGLMQREMETPTPALDRLVREAIRPRVDYATRLIAELMRADPEDPRVRAVNASVHGITLLLVRAPVVTRLLPAWQPTPEALESFAQLITRFTLAGIRELAGPGRGAR